MALDSTIPFSIGDNKNTTYNGQGAMPSPEGGKRFVANQRGARRESPTDWVYLYVHHTKVKAMWEKIQDLRERSEYIADLYPEELGFTMFVPDIFVHTSTRYVCDSDNKRHKKLVQTISGLIFLQGKPTMVKRFLDSHFPGCYPVNSCTTGKTAVIPDSVMQPFRTLAESDPTRVRILKNPLDYYARGHVKVQIMSGDFKGQCGYIIRIDRDRKLVLSLDNNLTLAIGGIHKEDIVALEDVNQA